MRRGAIAVALPGLVVRQVVLVVDPVLHPALGHAEIRLQADRLQVETVASVVQEQRQLTVDVHRPQVLRSGAEQHHLVVAVFQVVAQAPEALVDVAEVVGLVHQHRPAMGELLHQVDASPRQCRVNVSARLLVVLRVWRGSDHAVGHHLSAQGEAFVERLPHGL